MSVYVPDPCATCDQRENAHAEWCPMSPEYIADPIPSDIPGTATPRKRRRAFVVCACLRN